MAAAAASASAAAVPGLCPPCPDGVIDVSHNANNEPQEEEEEGGVERFFQGFSVYMMWLFELRRAVC